MPLAPSIPPRTDPAVRTIAREWRRLTGGTGRGLDKARRTLVACSGGADSSALTLALAAAVGEPSNLFVVAHIVHDLRPAPQAVADRNAAQDLAAAVGLLFVETPVYPKAEGGNLEAAARRLRYDGLASLAKAHGCPYIATAHHADDQLETILMALLRGSGPRGLSGAAERRRKGSCTLIRPCLSLSHTDLQRLCLDAGWEWREDATNTDTTRLRSAIRHTILPQLEQLRPGTSRRAAASAALLRDASRLIDDRVRAILQIAVRRPDSLTIARASLAAERPIILGALLKAAATRLLRGRRQDRLTRSALSPVIRELRSHTRRTRRYSAAGLTITTTPDSLRLDLPDA